MVPVTFDCTHTYNVGGLTTVLENKKTVSLPLSIEGGCSCDACDGNSDDLDLSEKF